MTIRLSALTSEHIIAVVEENEAECDTMKDAWVEAYDHSEDDWLSNRHLSEHPTRILATRSYNEQVRRIEEIAADRGTDNLTALSILYFNNVRFIMENMYRTRSNDDAGKAKLDGLVQFVNDCTNSRIYTDEHGYVDQDLLAKVYSKFRTAEIRKQEIERAKKQREHEKVYGIKYNPDTGKVLSWQGVRKALKDAGYTVVKKGYQGIFVTSSKYTGIEVHILKNIHKMVPWTDEELLAKGYFLVDGVWMFTSPWNRKQVVASDLNLQHRVVDEDKVAEIENDKVEVKEALRLAGYVVHDNKYENIRINGESIIDVTGLKVK